MKKLLLLCLLVAGAWFGYQHWQESAGIIEPIEQPVFAEIRLQMPIEGREIEMALFGEMMDEADCRERAQRVWEKVIDGCATCTLSINDCSAELPSRYRRLFDNVPIHSTYLTFTRGERGERNGRMVIWGVTANEGNMLCDSAKAEFKKRYKGRVECVAARMD